MTYKKIAFIVEGMGEKVAYNSLYSRSLPEELRPPYVPVLNAGSCASVLKHLSEHLTDLSRLHDIETVVVSVDLKDVIDQRIVTDVENLINFIETEFDQWKKKASLDKRCSYIPKKIFVVPQIKKFESWIISDLEGLYDAGLLNEKIEEFDDTETVSSPDSWIKKNLNIAGGIKKPVNVKRIVSSIRPEKMRTRNRSFDRLFVFANSVAI